MKAQYATVCPACWGRVHEGDEIRRSADDTTWMHEECPDPIPEAKRDICPDCFTERAANGRCMCP